MQFDDPLGDCQPKPCSPFTSFGGVDLSERLENPLLISGCDARTIVDYRDEKGAI